MLASKRYFSLLILPLLLSSCSIDWNDSQSKKIGELEQKIVKLESEVLNKESERKAELEKEEMKKETLFKFNQECFSLADELKKKVAKLNKDYYDNEDVSSFVQVFYSPKENQCLWVLTQTKTMGEGYYKYFRLFSYGDDPGAAVPIDGCTESVGIVKYPQHDCGIFDEKLKGLKGVK